MLVFYFFLRNVLIGQVDEDLQIEQSEMSIYAARYHQLPEIIKVNDLEIAYAETTRPLPANKYKRSMKSGKEDLRQLQFSISLPGKVYNVTIRKSAGRNRSS